MPNLQANIVYLSMLISGASCSGFASAQQTVILTDSEQKLTTNSTDIALGDFDGDGDLDAMIMTWDSQPNTVWMNDGDGNFTDSGQSLGNRSSYSVALGDLDDDGDIDAVVANYYAALNTVWLNDGNGNFTDSGQQIGQIDTLSVALGDLDNDGDLDAIFGNDYGGSGVWMNDGSGVFSAAYEFDLNVPTSISLGDLNLDGYLDAVLAIQYGANAVWFNNGNGSFTDSGQSLDENISSYAAAVGDLDDDGDLDVMFANWPEPNTVWTNDGKGVLSDTGQALGSIGSSNSYGVELGDLDADGDLDAMVANFTSQPDTVWINDGNGNYTQSEQDLPDNDTVGLALGDLNSDGNLDAVVANYPVPARVWMNDASNISAVFNANSGIWHDGAREAIAMAAANDALIMGGASFDISGILDARDLPLSFEARAEIIFSEDLMFLPGDGSSFVSADGSQSHTYASSGRLIAPEGGQLLFNALEFLEESQFQQNGCSLLVNGPMATTGGVTYLSGEALAIEISTGIDGVNRVADDTDFFGDYVNAGSTIIQRGTLYIYGDLTNTGIMTGDFNNGFLRGAGPEEGDGYSIGGAYTIGSEASLVLPEPIWNLAVGGNLDIAIDDPARFAMAQATIELNGLAPGTQQTMETLSADLGATDVGFASSNFPIGTLRVASGSNTVLVNEHLNSTDTPCEALYVDRLVVEAGASLTTAGCRIYTNEAIIYGTVDNEDDIIVIRDCPADFDGDGVVNGLDLTVVLAAWGSSNSVADFNGDGTVDGQDLAVILAAWGSCTE